MSAAGALTILLKATKGHSLATESDRGRAAHRIERQGGEVGEVVGVEGKTLCGRWHPGHKKTNNATSAQSYLYIFSLSFLYIT